MELARFLGELHPILVHFPIVFWLTAIVMDVAGFCARRERWLAVGKGLLIAGTVSALYAVVCGIFAETWAARAGVPIERIETHETAAIVATWIFIALTAARLYLTPQQPFRFASYLGVGILTSSLLIVTAYSGGELVYRYGSGVEPAQMSPGFPLEDLRLLAQQQDPESIRYSDFMHHIFGGMVLLLSLLLLSEALEIKSILRLRWLGPAAMMAGGIYLMIFSDTDSWPLSSERLIYDKEVLFHKIIALALFGIGLGGLLRKSETRWQLQARLIAIFALVGGALLFTHLHSVAPYANVALGVYLHHTVMGTVALAIGAAKLLEERFPLSRTARLAFPLLMAIESIFLIRYNEGLPWFMGYREVHHAPVYGGVIANLGDARAELIFNPATQRIDVYTLVSGRDQSIATNKLVALGVAKATLFIEHGHQITEVPLRMTWGPPAQLSTNSSKPDKKEAKERRGAHLTGEARFLHNTSVFSAKLRLETYGDHFTIFPTAYFEPWVDLKPNPISLVGLAKFHCPMHEYVRSHKPSQCPECNMALTPIQVVPDAPLHDKKFAMRFSATLDPVVDKPTTLSLTPTTVDGKIISDVQIVHEKLMHLLIAKADLSSFDHVHPSQQPDGRFVLPYTFATAGDYLLFADLTPAGERTQIFRMPVKVGAPSENDFSPTVKPPIIRTPVVPLFPDAALAREFRGIRVALSPDPPTLKKQQEITLTFSLSSEGEPIKLYPWLGAMGHCIAIHEDTQTLLHFHPASDRAPNGAVTMHAVFPRPGLYKLWAQFRIAPSPSESDENILTADFVVRVR